MVKKKKSWKKYTEVENETLLNCIKEGKNVYNGCKDAAQKLVDRTSSALEVHYYQTLVKKGAIIVFDGIRVYRPRKPRDLSQKQPSQITNVMRKLLKLSNKDREKILNFFK